MEMKVTRIKTKHGKWGKPLAMTVEELAAAISSDKWQTEVERIALTRHRDRLPYVIFSGLFDRQGLHCLRQPTGLMLLSIDLPADPTRAALLRHSVEQLPQTVMAFTGVSRHTLKVVVRCQPANGLLPTDSTAYLSFLSLAQQQAARYIEAMCGCEVPLVEESLQRGCRLSQDAQVYVNAGAVPLTVLSTVAVLAAYPLARTDRYGNPVHEFLAGCGSWDRQRDYIGELARRVPCRYAEWPQLFHRWFLGMVAAWLGRSSDRPNMSRLVKALKAAHYEYGARQGVRGWYARRL